MESKLKHFTTSRKKTEILNKHIEIELEYYKHLHRDILLSIYDIGKGYSTREILASYFKISEKALNDEYLPVLYDFNLIYYSAKHTKDSIIGLTQFGLSYCKGTHIMSYTPISSIKKIRKAISRSKYLYSLASKCQQPNFLSNRYDRDGAIYNILFSSHKNSFYLNKNDFVSKVDNGYIDISKQLENHNIYLCDCNSEKIVFSFKYTNYNSLIKKLFTIYNYLNQFICVFDIKVEVLLYVEDASAFSIDVLNEQVNMFKIGTLDIYNSSSITVKDILDLVKISLYY